ncbi:MAG: hypothetical protein Q9166_005265 [cf. Caloplaca sp. 2 TL-2023]
MTVLQNRWKEVYGKTLPSLALSKSPVQKVWQVHLDHCFARVILDNTIGKDQLWTSKLPSPAFNNMTPEQLESCIALGKAIAEGKEDLVKLDAKSLGLRGKKQKPAPHNQRKRQAVDTVGPEMKGSTPKKRQLDIKSALSSPKPTANTQESEPNISDPITLINTSNLSPFRQRVLLALCQVPSGRFTTYAALSNHLDSSARAVGNGLRNNPFAPRVPCHRVVASDLSLGGFGGEWGKEGKFAGEKVRLLREEGVIVDEVKGVVEGQVWRRFR